MHTKFLKRPVTIVHVTVCLGLRSGIIVTFLLLLMSTVKQNSPNEQIVLSTHYCLSSESIKLILVKKYQKQFTNNESKETELLHSSNLQ